MIAREEVSDAVYAAIAQEFTFPDTEIHDETCALDVPGWDSISNATLILEIEDRLGVELPLQEVVAAKNVGCMVDIIVADMQRKDASR